MTDNLAVRIASDPILIKNVYTKLDNPNLAIPTHYENTIKKLSTLKSTEKGVLVAKVTSPENYQTQMDLISRTIHLMDHLHEINTDLYTIHFRWTEMLKVANRHITLTYFNELNDLKDGVRKTVISSALQPVQDGVDKAQHLIDRGEASYKHLNTIVWGLKEGTSIIKEYLNLLKYGSGIKSDYV